MTTLQREVNDLTNDLFFTSGHNLTAFEAMQIAVKIQHNRILEDAFMTGRHNSPGALEAIAMELGANISGTTIKDALYNLKP
jgi:hypothetical protein